MSERASNGRRRSAPSGPATAIRPHRCAIPSCDRVIDRQKLMCPEHWQLVPRALQRGVYHQWNRGQIRAGYERAVALAVAAVREQLETQLDLPLGVRFAITESGRAALEARELEDAELEEAAE